MGLPSRPVELIVAAQRRLWRNLFQRVRPACRVGVDGGPDVSGWNVKRSGVELSNQATSYGVASRRLPTRPTSEPAQFS